MIVKIRKNKDMRRYGLAIILLLMVCILTEGATRLKWLEPVESFWYDIWHQMSGKQHDPQHVAIAAVDDQTLGAHPDEPLAFWSPHFAKAIKVLRKVGASVIGIDFIFTVSAESWFHRFDMGDTDVSRTYDIAFREQLSLGNVVLIGMLTKGGGENRIIMPINDYLFALAGNYADLGLANLYMDDDDVVRRFMPKIVKDAPLSGLILGALLAQRSGSRIGQDDFSDMLRNIGFAGPPGTIPRISFSKLLSPGAESDPEVKLLSGKVVIIGLENSGTSDIHLTPYSRNFFLRSNRMMSGPEIHANIVETLLSNQYPRHIPQWMRMLWLISAALAGTYVSFRSSPAQCVGCLIGIAAVCTAAAYIAFLNSYILPLAGVHLALGLCYIGALGMRLDREERTRLRLQKVLSPYVSDAVVKQVLSSKKLPDLGGETLNVTVLFSDIRNFTTLSERLKPYEVVEILNHYYTLVCEPILAGGAMVDKFIGDAVMAIFGAPASYPNQTRQAVIAALSIRDIAERFRVWMQERFPDKTLPEFHVGVGLHTGEAVIGNIGSVKRMSYTAIGDTVNIASRLESMSKKLGWNIVASRATVDAAGAGIKIGRTESITPSGRAGEIEIVEILGIE
jgi:class 3 adenylate cyclase/CHASE2 domain-containing sensor protein